MPIIDRPDWERDLVPEIRKRDTRTRVVDALHQTLAERSFTIRPIYASYYYQHWEDADPEVAMAPPIGYHYHFWIEINQFFISFGLSLLWVDVPKQYVRVEIIQRMSHRWRGFHEYLLNFTSDSRDRLQEMGFKWTGSGWGKNYPAPAETDPEMLAGVVAGELDQIARLPALVCKPSQLPIELRPVLGAAGHLTDVINADTITGMELLEREIVMNYVIGGHQRQARTKKGGPQMRLLQFWIRTYGIEGLDPRLAEEILSL